MDNRFVACLEKQIEKYYDQINQIDCDSEIERIYDRIERLELKIQEENNKDNEYTLAREQFDDTYSMYRNEF